MKPLLTIITSTYNACKELPLTAESIRCQTCKNIQWIIADGGSTDGTLDWIKSNSDLIDVWFSQRDKGIYDAWNKALGFAKGEWIQFLGAGDELAATDVIDRFESVLMAAHPKYDLVYGKIHYVSGIHRKVIQEVGEPWEAMQGKWEILRPKLPIHPEVFHHSSLFNSAEPFDLRFRIAADSHFLLKAIRNKPPLFYPLVVDRMLVGGVSAQYKNSMDVLREIKMINRDLGIKTPVAVVIRDYGKALLKKFLSAQPKTWMSALTNIGRKVRGLESFCKSQ